MRIVKTAIFAMVFAGVCAGRADAIPVLQLDLRGGVYDPVTQTIVAPGAGFELFAILTPATNASAAQIDALLNTTYFISVALQPPRTVPGDLGSFGFAGDTYTATDGLYYGTPPVENLSDLQPRDPGDLPTHAIFPTYFTEVGFKFDRANTTQAYNTADNPGGPSGTGNAFYASFTGDASALTDNYVLHFDLYDEVAAKCAKTKSCTPDLDVNRFAPFSHDAQTTTQVPEPASGLLLLLGSAFLAAGLPWRRK